MISTHCEQQYYNQIIENSVALLFAKVPESSRALEIRRKRGSFSIMTMAAAAVNP